MLLSKMDNAIVYNRIDQYHGDELSPGDFLEVASQVDRVIKRHIGLQQGH